MEYKIKGDKTKDFFELVDELENLITERISDLHEVKGGKQARHAYILYRKILREAKYLIQDNLEEIEEEKNKKKESKKKSAANKRK